MSELRYTGGQALDGTGYRPPLSIVVMGVSGSGKSTVGAQLAAELELEFIDGDALHPPEHVAKMAAGTPLDDDDRLPWLRLIGVELAGAPQPGLVIACSALKKSYRQLIGQIAPGTFFLHLDGPEHLLVARLGGRAGHFMPPALLASQLATLEPLSDDECGVRLGIKDPVTKVVQDAVRHVRAALESARLVQGAAAAGEGQR